jgi:hypothetical protein
VSSRWSRGPWSRWSRWTRLAVGLAAAGLIGASAGAQEPEAAEAPSEPISLNLLITHLSNQEGGEVDASAKKLDDKLRSQFRYNSLKVVQKERMNLQVDEVGTLTLPDGRVVHVQPMHKGKDGVLMAIDVEEAVRTDVRVLDDHMVVIGAGNYEDGKLAISVEPDYE